jgi:ATP-dependent RNA helicase RhlE
VHRIGRTGRAGANGEAISLVASDETGLLRDIERVLRRPIPTLPTPVFKILESVALPPNGERSYAERQHGSRPHQNGQHRHGGGGGNRSGGARRDAGSSNGGGNGSGERRRPSSSGNAGSGSGSGTRSFGQPQRGRFR